MKRLLAIGSILGILYGCASSSSECDCPNSEICDYGVCVAYPGAKPEATWNGFKEALQQGNLEKMIEFCDPSARERCERLFSGSDLGKAAQELTDSQLTLESDKGYVRTYSLSIGDKDYPVIFYKEGNRWMIHGL